MGYFFGVSGVIITTIITILFIGFPLTAFYTYKYAFKSKAKNFIIEEFLYVFIFCIIGLISYWACSFISAGVDVKGNIIEIISKLILNIGVTSILYLIIFSKFKIFEISAPRKL